MSILALADAPRRRDGCVVESRALSALLSSFIEEWRKTRPIEPSKRFARRAIVAVSPIEYLSLETGIPERTIKNVVHCAYHTTELRIADPLVAAMGRPEVFYDGTLTVQPNPIFKEDRCCGGSTVDSPALAC